MPEKSVVLIGSETLLGREMRDVLSETPPFKHRVQLIGTEPEKTVLASGADEAVIITPLEAESLAGAGIAFLAGSADSSKKAFEMLSGMESAPDVIDLSLTLEDRPHARLRAPMVEPKGYEVPDGSLHVVAQPAAIALALLLGRLHESFPVRRAVVQVFEPVSERGNPGLQELQKQCVNLLSFQKLPQDVYDVQVAFNMLPRFGTEAPQSLENFENRIERHLATLLSLSSKVPMPSLRLLQAPVFHGYSMSVWVEFEKPADPKAIGEELASVQIEVRTGDEEPPSNVSIAGQSGITITVERDRNEARACWFWIVADNFRVVADNAVMVAQGLLRSAK